MPRERHGGRKTAATSSPTPRPSSSSSSSSSSSHSSSKSSWSAPSSSPRPSAASTSTPRTEKSSSSSHTPSYSSSSDWSYPRRSSDSSFFDGFLWRSGWELASRIFGPRTVKVEVSDSETSPVIAATSAPAPVETIMGPSSCHTHAKSFFDCIKENEEDISKCQFYMDMLSQCKKSPADPKSLAA